MLRRLWFSLAYYQRPPWDTGISPPELMDFINTHPPGKALDLGCGTGTNSITLAKSGWQVTGVDFAPRAVRLARNKAQQNGVRVDFRQDNVTRLGTNNLQFDLILDIGCFHSQPAKERPKYTEVVERLLAPLGTYLLYVFFTERFQIPGPGVTQSDIDALSAKLELVQRVDSTERGIRPSAWLTFRKRN